MQKIKTYQGVDIFIEKTLFSRGEELEEQKFLYFNSKYPAVLNYFNEKNIPRFICSYIVDFLEIGIIINNADNLFFPLRNSIYELHKGDEFIFTDSATLKVLFCGPNEENPIALNPDGYYLRSCIFPSKNLVINSQVNTKNDVPIQSVLFTVQRAGYYCTYYILCNDNCYVYLPTSLDCHSNKKAFVSLKFINSKICLFVVNNYISPMSYLILGRPTSLEREVKVKKLKDVVNSVRSMLKHGIKKDDLVQKESLSFVKMNNSKMAVFGIKLPMFMFAKMEQ